MWRHLREEDMHRNHVRPPDRSALHSGTDRLHARPDASMATSAHPNIAAQLGNQAMLALLGARGVAPPTDHLERQAQRTARAVLRADPRRLAGHAQQPIGERRPAFSRTTPACLDHHLGSGQQLPPGERVFFEPRLGTDLSSVRVHTGGRADHAATAVNAQAFTLGDRIVFARGEYAPATAAGRVLLAHELVHVKQQQLGLVGAVIQRYPWQDVTRRRELRPAAIPSRLNYELRDHRLWAHTRSAAEFAQVITLVETLHSYYGTVANTTRLRSALQAARQRARAGQLVSVDITDELPENLRDYLGSLESFYSAYRAHMQRQATTPNPVDGGLYRTPDDIFRRYGSRILQPTPQAVLAAWYRGLPSHDREYRAACHQFLMLAISGSPQGVSPGQYAGGAYATPLGLNLAQIRRSYATSIQGRGPHRVVPRRDVQVGDIAVFRQARATSNLPDRIIHSALVIRVAGRTVELLEKTNPHQPQATRTVAQVLRHYSSDRATVTFLAPALQGMPAQAPRRLGDTPPTTGYTVATGTVPEDTHVLFRVNTHVLLAHEDQKLFALIARVRRSRQVTAIAAHGYASEEGDQTYNLNLSAHRAVRVQQALRRQLPRVSRIDAVARGETTAFGRHPLNRRVGIAVTRQRGGPAATPPARPGTQPQQRQAVPPGQPRGQAPGPRSGAPTQAVQPVPGLVPPPDLGDLMRPFHTRGVPSQQRDIDAVLQQRSYAYEFFRATGMPPERAAQAADAATAIAADRALSRDYPTRPEQLERSGQLPESTTFGVDVLEVLRMFRGGGNR